MENIPVRARNRWPQPRNGAWKRRLTGTGDRIDGGTVSELANHFWEELEQRWEELEERSAGSEQEVQDSPESAEPWAKTSSGDADGVTTE
jgi:hypothetical protein